MSSLGHIWQRLPRVARWGVSAALSIGLYFIGMEPTVDQMAKYTSRADADATVLSQYASGGESLKNAARALSVGVRQFGEVKFPADPEQTALELNRTVDEILRKHGIEGVTTTSRVSSMGNKGPFATKMSTTHNVERVIKQVDFEAMPEPAFAVLADLEKSPLVTTISTVQIRQADARDRRNRNVVLSLTIEAWQLAKKGVKS